MEIAGYCCTEKVADSRKLLLHCRCDKGMRSIPKVTVRQWKRGSMQVLSAKRETVCKTVTFKVTRSVTADKPMLENDCSTV